MAEPRSWTCGRCGHVSAGLTPHDLAECRARVHCETYGHSWVQPGDNPLKVCAECYAEEYA